MHKKLNLTHITTFFTQLYKTLLIMRTYEYEYTIKKV